MKDKNLHGAWPALATPYTTGGAVNLTVLKEFVEYLVADKAVDGLYACGSTAQGLFLSVAERRAITEAVIQQANGRLPVIVHIGSPVLADAISLAKHAADCGADGISSVIPPLYTEDDAIVAYYQAVAGSVPELPFFPYFFNIEKDAVQLAASLLHLPNLAGAKYTGPNLYELKGLLDLRQERWTIFAGMDQQCAYAAMAGSPGNIGSTLNHFPGVYRAIHKSVAAGDLPGALRCQEQANRATRVMSKFGFFGAIWETLRWMGFEFGAPRLPAQGIPADKAPDFRTEMEQAGFWELVKM